MTGRDIARVAIQESAALGGDVVYRDPPHGRDDMREELRELADEPPYTERHDPGWTYYRGYLADVPWCVAVED